MASNSICKTCPLSNNCKLAFTGYAERANPLKRRMDLSNGNYCPRYISFSKKPKQGCNCELNYECFLSQEKNNSAIDKESCARYMAQSNINSINVLIN